MNVTDRIIWSFVAGAVATAAAILFAPEYNFSQHIAIILQIGFLSTLILAAVSFYREEDLTLHDKNVLMTGFLIAVLGTSLYTAGAFVHQSQTSWSGGEIHYHADFEVLAEQDGELERLNLIDPANFCEDTEHEASYMCNVNDRTGSTEYHEHNDNRIHLEGTFKKRENATLSAFFEQFNGELTNEKLVYPTNDGTVEVEESGNKSLKIIVNRGVGQDRHWCIIGEEVPKRESCQSFDGRFGESPSDYVVSPYTQGPNLDDIFIVYDSVNADRALQDMREDGKYKGFGLLKSGEGYNGGGE